MIQTKEYSETTMHHRQDLYHAMLNGNTLITPNNRLSNQLLHDFFKQLDRPLINKPSCLPYSMFLQSLYKKARHLYANQPHPILLTQQQQRYLWKHILWPSEERSNDGLLDEIQEAWARCQHWLINIDQPLFLLTPQTRQFQCLAQQFQQRLTDLGAITEEQLANHLLTYPELFRFDSIIWVCFDDYTPQQHQLQQAITNEGCQQHHYDLPKTPSTSHLYAAKDVQDERSQMIQWIKNKLNAQEQRIGIVVPNLQKESHQLQRQLQQHLPSHLFDISLGQSLGKYPLVAHGLLWLNLKQQPLRHHEIRLLLQSPYLAGSKNEFMARSEALQNNTLLKEPMMTLDFFLKKIKDTSPQLANILNTITTYPSSAPPMQWVELFKARLTQLGFPGDYPLSSSTYQCFQRLISLFDEFLQLAVIQPIMTPLQALDALKYLATYTIFQEKKPTSPIQIMGLLEASGCTFTSLWISGLTDQCLPQKPRLSAFIPIPLQREQQMPHAISIRELKFAQQLIQRLKNSSPDNLFSYSRFTKDTPNLPSPLILDLPPIKLQIHSQDNPMIHLIQQNETYLLPYDDKTTITGGTAILANQAKCPFRAFAMHRLHAKCPSNITHGLDISERGQVMHKILELLWHDLRSQQQLLSLKPNELQEKVNMAIARSLKPIIQEKRSSFPPLIQEIEASRFSQLINTCLSWEKHRPDFTVEAIEQNFSLHLSGINFHVRVDRIDQITSDKKWVIDYKSSLPQSKPWQEDRPESPQLLLYALLNHQINALIFIQLKHGQIVCGGLSEENVAIPGISHLKNEEHWQQKQEEWHKQLSQLAQEFREGYCVPKPNRTTTCQQCEFPNLCRIETI